MRGQVACILLITVFVTVGCEPQRTLVSRMAPLTSDVPVPSTFKFDPKHSTDFTSQTTNERYNNYHYTGRAYFVDVVGFYKRQMPVDGWVLGQDVGTGGRQTLFFRKRGADPDDTSAPTCIVTIFSRDDMATAIRIQRMER